MDTIVGLKELRQNLTDYAAKVKKGHSFIVFKRSKPLFKLIPLEDEAWEEVIDFTTFKKGGVAIDDVLSRL